MSNSVSGVNIGDVIATTITLGLMVVPIVLIVLFYRAYKRNVQRADERLQIEKQQTFQLQQQVNELKERIGKIESLLKEVD